MRQERTKGLSFTAHLNITGPRVDPDRISGYLGLDPSESWRMGDPVGLRNRIAPSGLWEIWANPLGGQPCDRVFSELLALLRGLGSKLRRLAKQHAVLISCGAYISHCSDVFAEWGWSWETACMVADLGVPVDFSVYPSIRRITHRRVWETPPPLRGKGPAMDEAMCFSAGVVNGVLDSRSLRSGIRNPEFYAPHGKEEAARWRHGAWDTKCSHVLSSLLRGFPRVGRGVRLKRGTRVVVVAGYVVEMISVTWRIEPAVIRRTAALGLPLSFVLCPYFAGIDE